MLRVYKAENTKPLLGSEESVMAGDYVEVSQNESEHCGQLYTWGRGKEGQLGQNEYRYPLGCCALPKPVRGFHNVVQVACGGGVQGCTAVVTATGKVFTFGSNFKGRLGHDADVGECLNVPRQVAGVSESKTVAIACGLGHMLCLTDKGKVYSWGTNTDGCLGRVGISKKNCQKTSARHFDRKKNRGTEAQPPSYVSDLKFGMSSKYSRPPSTDLFCKFGYDSKSTSATSLAIYTGDGDLSTSGNHLVNVSSIDACGNVSAAVLSDGRLCLWGKNKSGELGNGDYHSRSVPHLVKDLMNVRQVSVGSRFCGAVTNEGEIYMWGYGGSGNLGLGNRKSYSTPQRVLGRISDEHMRSVACSKNQDCGVTMGYHGTKLQPGGHEGPHTVALSIYGEVYTWGTAFCGALGNIGKKTKGIGKSWDELLPYKFGSKVHNDSKERKNAPLSPYAVWPAPYSKKVGPVASVSASNSRTTLVSRAGRAFVFGNGGDDGRAGVERFLTKAGGHSRRQIDRDSCILTQPHQIGQFRDKYWKGGPAFRHISVLAISMGTTHSAAICTPDRTAFTDMPHSLGLDASDPGSLVDHDYVIEEKIPWKNISHRSPKNIPNANRDKVFQKHDDWWKMELKMSSKQVETEENFGMAEE
eukprot:g7720.t1